MKTWILFPLAFLSGCAQTETVTRQIGCDGARIELGKASIVFREAALPEKTSIVLSRPGGLPARLPKEEALVGDLLRIEPKGMVFRKQAEITLPLKEELLPEGVGAENRKIYLAYHNGEGWIRVGGSVVDKENRTVSALISHSGEYCIVCRKDKYGISYHPYEEGDTPVLLLHGIMAPSESFGVLRKHLKRKYSHPVWIFEYPRDQKIERSAELLSRELSRLHEKYGEFKLNLVGHGVGGLVALYYMLDDTLYHDDLEKMLITIATPNKGSRLATHDDVLTSIKRMEDAGLELTPQDISILFSFADALGKTGEQIREEENNPFYEKLATLRKAYWKKMSVYRGDREPLRIHIECFSGDKPYPLSEDCGLFLSDLDELVNGAGDTYVSVRSTMLSALENRPFTAHHYEILSNEEMLQDLVGYLELESYAWPELIRNLAKPGGLAKIAETWEQGFRLEQGHPVNFQIILEFARNLLNSCEKDGILLTNGDNDTFPLWWVQANEGFREDVAVVNLSLLNTACFIKYLKGHPHRVPMALSDEEIDSLKPIKEGGETTPISHQVVDELLTANAWKRSVYYAVTVSSRYFKHPRISEGLVLRIVESEADCIDTDKYLSNLHGVYSYETLFDREGNLVHGIDPVTRKLLTNYAALYLGAGRTLRKTDDDRARREFEMSLRFVAEDPMWRVHIGRQYKEMGDTARAETLFVQAIDAGPSLFKAYEALAKLYGDTGRKTRAVRLLSQWVQRHPNDTGAIKLLASYGD